MLAHRFFQPKVVRCARNAALLAAAFGAPYLSAARGGVVVDGGGLTLIEERGTFAGNNVAAQSAGAVAFAYDSLEEMLGAGIHSTSYLNDTFYGNSNSWIGNGAIGTSGPIAGVAFDGSFNISSFAFGRSNVLFGDPCGGGICTDRSLGLYTLQYTSAPNPTAATDDSQWSTIGTIDYQPGIDGGIGPQLFGASHARHRYNFNPVNATGIRLIVPASGIDGGTAIDEIEVYSAAGPVPPPHTPLIELAETSGTFAENNLATGGTAFALDALEDQLGFGIHATRFLNDGIYGNANSWIGNGATIFDPSSPTDARAFAGINLGANPQTIRSVAWGRDNEGTFGDRAGGQYLIQYTTTPNPDAATPESAWVTLEEVTYGTEFPSLPALRHRYNFAAVSATGVRIIVPGTGLAGGTAIDEIELYQQAGDIAGPVPPLKLTPALGYRLTWDGNNGDFNDPNDPAIVPDNLALANKGVVPFGSTQLDFGVHYISNVNDGFYGNSRSWIADFANGDADPFIGVAFDGAVDFNAIAFGRDNGNTLTDACGGTCTDRSLGSYTIQVTLVDNPDAFTLETGDTSTGWATVGELKYNFDDETFTSYLRHEFSLTTAGGGALSATGLRIKVSNPNLAIDEIEVYLRELALAGDTNGDGIVDLEDLNNVRNNFGGSGLGDTDGDDDVDLDDLNNVRNNFGSTAGAQAVPEPSTAILLTLFGVSTAAVAYRRRK